MGTLTSCGVTVKIKSDISEKSLFIVSRKCMQYASSFGKKEEKSSLLVVRNTTSQRPVVDVLINATRGNRFLRRGRLNRTRETSQAWERQR
jgi:hypothetical protein